jgi:hypothetical protein
MVLSVRSTSSHICGMRAKSYREAAFSPTVQTLPIHWAALPGMSTRF